MSHGPLHNSFFERSALVVAQDILGKFLMRSWRGRVIAKMITEVEAYDGFSDKASHAHRGITNRNKPMFGPAGYWYAYLTYGIHWLLNITTGPKGYPAAVLIRGVENVTGPGRVGTFFHVSGVLSGKSASKRTGLWIEDRGIIIRKKNIRRTARIGIDYAGPAWSKKQYRFLITV